MKESIKNNHEALFIHILENQFVQTVFQPIISLSDGSVFGYEALCRGPENTSLQSPKTLFEYATRLNRLWELESLCRQKALENAHRLQLNGKLFLNVNPNIMSDPKFQEGFTKSYLKQYQLTATDIVFELTEEQSIAHTKNFQRAVEHYKQQQYELAIDDVGSGYSGLNVIANVQPHYLKLDRGLIHQIDSNATKQMLVKSLTQFANDENSKVIAEGIETMEEFCTLMELGVHYGQGFFIQRPCNQIMPIRKEVLEQIAMFQFHLAGQPLIAQSDMTIGSIAKALPMIDHKMLIRDVGERLDDNENLPGFCIEKEGKLVGVITRGTLAFKMSSMYGYSLYAKRPIAKIMSISFLAVESNASIRTVAELAMSRSNDKIYDFITITKNGSYFGMVTVKELLQKSMELEINYARHLNPLSGLPGNVLIENEITKCIDSSSNYALLYFDLDNFKPYNDVYGFERGDQVLIELAQIIEEAVSTDGFVGHIGGDDFIAVTTDETYQLICTNIIQRFDLEVKKHYFTRDLAEGFINSKNRHGQDERFPLLTISIAVLMTQKFSSIVDIAEKASEVKKKCKQIEGSCFVVYHGEEQWV